MGFLEFFFGRRESPATTYHDADLGAMVWSDDDDGWAGEYGGLQYVIAYDRGTAPNEELLSQARSMLSSREIIETALERAKEHAASEYPMFAAEIRGLTIGSAYFYIHKGVRRTLIDLDGGKQGRSWRMEFREHECEGIGVDT